MIYSFSEQLLLSQGVSKDNDIETIKYMVLGCIKVRMANKDEQMLGIDYYAVLSGGKEIAIDAKSRGRGASKYWRGEPELTLEIWSVMPNGKHKPEKPKVGWTLSKRNETELVLFKFSPFDCMDSFLLPFQHLRMAFEKNLEKWCGSLQDLREGKYPSKRGMYRVDIQETKEPGRKWESMAVFVPHSAVWDAIQDVSRGNPEGQILGSEQPKEPEPLKQGDLFREAV